MKKRLFTLILTLITAVSLSIPAYATSTASLEGSTYASNATPPIVTPLGILYHEPNLNIVNSPFTTPPFTAVKGNGNSLRYWFHNTGKGACTVQLLKKTILGYATAGSAFTVYPGGNASQVYNNPGNTTFAIKVNCTTGAAIKGELKANQLDLATN